MLRERNRVHPRVMSKPYDQGGALPRGRPRQALVGLLQRTNKSLKKPSGVQDSVLRAHKHNVACVALTPDGRRAISASRDSTLKVWDLGTGTCTAILPGHEDVVTSVALTPNGRRAISGSWDKTLKVWDLAAGTCTATLTGHEWEVTTVALTPDGKCAISGSMDGTLKVWDLKVGTCTVTLHGHIDSVSCVALTPNGKRALSGSRDMTLKVWDLKAGTCTATLRSHKRTVSSVALTPNGKRAISGSWDKTLRVWDLESGTCNATIRGHTQEVSTVALTHDGKRAISGAEDNTLNVWDLEDSTCIATLPGHNDSVTSVALTPDGRRAISGSGDDTLKMWDIKAGTCTATLPDLWQKVTSGAPSRKGSRAAVFSEPMPSKGTPFREQGPSKGTPSGHEWELTTVALTPNGKHAISGSHDNALKVWDLEDGKCTATLQGHWASVTCVAIDGFGERAISGSGDWNLKVWDLKAGKCTATLHGHCDGITCVALNRSGQRAISGSEDGTLRVWDPEDGTCTATLPGHENGITCVALDGFGECAISGSEDGTLRVWDLESVTGPITLPGHEYIKVTSVALTSDGKCAISGSEDCTLRVWDLEAGTCKATLCGHKKQVTCVALTEDGQRAISSSWDETLKVWDLEACTCTATLAGLEDLVTCAALTPDGQRAISGSGDDTLKVWDLESGTYKATLSGHTEDVSSVALTPNGKCAISGSWDKTLKVWDLEAGICTTTLPGHEWGVTTAALTKDGKRAISGSGDKTLKVWDLKAGICTTTLCGHLRTVTSVALTRCGKRAISGSRDKTLKVWDLAAGTCTATLYGHEREVTGVALTPDGRGAISGSMDKTLKVWDLEAGKCTATLANHKEGVTCVALTSDGKRAISGSEDYTLQVWDLEAGTCTATLSGHKFTVTSVALAPDGERAISGSKDGTLRVWDLGSGTCTASLPGHNERITCVALTPDGRRAISGSADCALKVWEPELVGFCGTDHACMPNIGQGSGDSQYDAGTTAAGPMEPTPPDTVGKSESQPSREDATATVTEKSPNHRFRIGDAFELQLEVQLRLKTLAATLVPHPMAGHSIQGTAEPKADSRVVFFIPVPGRLEAVQARVVPLEGRDPEVAVTCIYELPNLDLAGGSGSVYRLRWVSWLSDLPRGRVDIAHGLPSLESGRLNTGHGSPRLGPYLSYMHHLAGAGNVKRHELYRQHATRGFLATVQKWPVQRAALRTRDLVGRTPLEVLLSDDAGPEDLSDMLEAYLYDAGESASCGDLSALACNLECLVRCLPRIKELNMVSDLVWKALDLYACTRTAASDVGVSAAQRFAPVDGSLWRPKRCTFTAQCTPVPPKEKRESERFHLIRCSVPGLFDAVPSGVFAKLLPASADMHQEVSKVKTVAPSLPFVPWETILEQMPKRFFGMPLARAAVEHRRPTALLAVAFAVHLLITVLFCALLTWRPQGQARLVLLSVLVAADVLLILEEGLQLVDSFSAMEPGKPWAKRWWSAAASYLGSFYNVIDLALCLSPPILLLVLLLAGPDSPGYLMALALGALSCFLKYLNFMRAVPYFAPIVAMMERIIDRTRPDMALLLVLTAGFGAANHTLLQASRYYELHFWQMLLRHLLRYTLGDAGIFEYESEAEIVDGALEVDDGVYLDASHVLDNPLLFAMFIIVNIGYAYLTVVIFFNLIIARMGSIYEEVEERQLSSLTYSCACIFEEYHRKWVAAKRLVGFRKSEATSPATTGAGFLFRWHPVTEALWEPSTRAAPESGTRPIFKTIHMVEDLEVGLKAQGNQLNEVKQQLVELKQMMEEMKQQKADLGRQEERTAGDPVPQGDLRRELTATMWSESQEDQQLEPEFQLREQLEEPQLMSFEQVLQRDQLADLTQEQAEQGKQLADIKEQQAKILQHLVEFAKQQ